MHPFLEIEHHIQPFWEIIHNIRGELKCALGACWEEYKEAGMMTASELLENAIKYSGTGSNIGFKLFADEQRIAIETRNPLVSPRAFADLKARIAAINAGDPEALYISRLQALMENPDMSSTGLGLYRIAYEGKFDLSCRQNSGDQVIVRAQRQIILNSLQRDQ